MAKNSNPLSIVNDQIGSPTYSRDLAEAVCKAIFLVEENKKYGIFHYSGYRQCSWYDFAIKIFEEAGFYGLITPKIIAVESDYFQLPASRPGFSVLDNNKIRDSFGIEPSNWEEGIKKSIKAIYENNEL